MGTDMKSSSRSTRDSTAETAVGDVTGEALLIELFSRVTDREDRALLIAHGALGISLEKLAHQFGTSCGELAGRVEAILGSLRQDAELASLFSGIHRAGRNDHFQAMIIHIGLKDWFCSYCGQFMVQPQTGRPRKTCSNLCRHRLWREERRSAGLFLREPHGVAPGPQPADYGV
jgi:hypothetical protein